MSGTGRLRGALSARTRRVVYGEPAPAEVAAELAGQVRVDRAHVVMLAEQELIPRATARELLRFLDLLASDGFQELADRPAPRGTYLMYESHLIEKLGEQVGGVLHSGRSRNDLNAALTSLRARHWLLEAVAQATRLEALLLGRARAYQSVVMPLYTHFQAAMPATFGYYLLGVARAVGREVDALTAAGDGLRECPLGAVAVAGTDLPIDPARTAALLGFDAPVAHALDAVASRDALLRILGVATALAVVISRLGTDLQVWSTEEFGFVQFPDHLVGSSSAMPQKRNAFLLEHVKAAPGQALGAWTAAAAGIAATPFTNTIEVGTEAAGRIWPGLAAVERAVLLAQVLVAGARPDADRMAARAESGFTAATAVANRLVRRGVPFRTAHRQVGEAVRAAIEAGTPAGEAFADLGGPSGPADLAALVAAHRYGGGPGAFAEQHRRARAGWAARVRWLQQWRSAVDGADAALNDAVRSIVNDP